MAIYCSWLNGILVAPVLWIRKSAGFDLDTKQAYILNQPKPEFIATEVLPMMTKLGFIIGTVFDSPKALEDKARNTFIDSRHLRGFA